MIDKSLVAELVHIWSRDPALDRKTDPEKYLACWQKFLKDHDPDALKPVTKEGVEPTRFTLVPLTRRQFQAVSRLSGQASDNELVALGLKKIDRFQHRGTFIGLEFTDGENGKRLDAETLDKIWDPFLFAELAARVLEISHIDPTRGQD